jgi:hypothetical protein
VIVDTLGHYVWYHLIDGMEGNLMRAFLSHDGTAVVYCMAGPQNALQDGKIVRVSLDGADVRDIPVPYLDHDMTELPDGTVTGIVVEDSPDHATSADTLVEIAPDGTQTTVWSAWDTWDPVAEGFSLEHNWTHANAVDYSPADDAYYLSLKSLETLLKIDRSTGEVEWAFGGDINEFTFLGTTLGLHHQFEVLDGSILLFENDLFDDAHVGRGYSRAVEMAIDEDARTAAETWTFQHDPPLSVPVKGDVHRFADGSTQIVWSTAGEIQDVTPDGEVTWQLDLDIGQVITFVQVADSLYGAP